MRKFVVWLALVLAMASGMGLAETAEDPYLMYDIPFGMQMEEAIGRLEEQFGVEFEVVHSAYGSSTDLRTELPLTEYGIPATLRYWFFLDYGMVRSDVYFHGDVPTWSVNEEGKEKFNAPTIVKKETESIEKFHDIIDETVDEMSRIYGIVVGMYGIPTGGKLNGKENQGDYVKEYDYPIKGEEPDWDILRKLAKKNIEHSLVTYWGDVILQFTIRARTHTEANRIYDISATANMKKTWWSATGLPTDEKYGFQGAYGECTLFQE